jgi:hypothetical protein
MLVAAAIAVPLLAALQYRWLTDLAAAQRMEWRQRQAEAVVRGATAINDDFSSFHAVIVEIARDAFDMTAIDRAATRWKSEARTMGPLALIYAHDARAHQWLPLAGSPPGGDDSRSFVRAQSTAALRSAPRGWCPMEDVHCRRCRSGSMGASPVLTRCW